MAAPVLLLAGYISSVVGISICYHAGWLSPQFIQLPVLRAYVRPVTWYLEDGDRLGAELLRTAMNWAIMTGERLQ
jgi:hypothetical protein